MIVVINGVETEINSSLFSYGEMIKKRDQINYIDIDFSSINYLKGDKNILKNCFKETKKELLAFDSRYAEFNAFNNGAVFNNTKNTNAKGYSNYWETGMIYPDKILRDMILIFHPELKTKIINDFYYYEKLN